MNRSARTFDGDTSRAQLVQEISDLRSRLAASEQQYHELSREMARLRFNGMPEREEQFRLLFENSLDAVLLTRPDGGITAANPAACALFGYSEEELCLAGRSKILDTEDPRLRMVLDERQRGGRVHGRELTAIRRNGERFEVELDSIILPGQPVQSFVIMRDITARKLAEEDLRESEKRLQLFIRNSPASLAMLDREMRYLSYSRRWLTDYGLGDRNLVGMSHYDVFPEVPARWREFHRRALSGETLQADSDWFERTDGSLHYLRWELRPWRDPAGNIAGIVVFSEDITQRKRAEATLRKSEAKFRSIFDNFSDPVFIYETGERFVEINAVACHRLGYTRDALLQMGPVDIAAPAYAHRLSELVEAIERQGQLVFECAHRHKDGTEFPVEVHSRKILYEGRPCIISVVRDITERKRAERELLKTRNTLQAVLDSAPAGVIVADRAGGILMTSAETDKILGGPITGNAHIPGGGIIVLNPDGSPIPHGRLPLSLALAGRTVSDTELLIVRENGTQAFILANATPLRNNEGGIWGAVTIFLDISVRKRVEERLQRLTATLEERVAERAALAESRTKQLQALAVELIEAEERERRQIAELLHDDLQQILAAAKMQIVSVCDQSTGDPTLAHVVRLLDACIDKSRRLSHELSPAVLHHSGLVPALEWLARQMNEQFGLRVEMEIDAPERFEGAPLRVFLFRAVQELLFNIVKHAGVKIARVELSSTEDSLAIVISDRGKGFDPENQTMSSKGIGLLSLKERASYVGGKMSIQSAPGQGSRFILTVPFRLPQADAAQPATPTTPQASASPGASAVANDADVTRVLFADDHKVIREGLIRLVAGQPSIKVVGEAANGMQAVEKARQLNPDVVVMDISMPLMDGVEATRWIKSELPQVRVIGLSMCEEAEIAPRMRDAGAEAFVSKNASSSELLKALYGIERGKQA